MTKFSPVIAVILLLNLFLNSQGATPVKVQLAARNLPSTDPFNGNPDTYAIISYAYGVSESFTTVGQTSTIDDDAAPSWKETFDIDGFVAGTSQRIRVEVYDDDFGTDEYLGYVEIFLAALVNAPNATIQQSLQPSGLGELVIQNIAGPTKTV